MIRARVPPRSPIRRPNVSDGPFKPSFGLSGLHAEVTRAPPLFARSFSSAARPTRSAQTALLHVKSNLGPLAPPVNQARCSINYMSILSTLTIFVKLRTYIGYGERNVATCPQVIRVEKGSKGKASVGSCNPGFIVSLSGAHELQSDTLLPARLPIAPLVPTRTSLSSREDCIVWWKSRELG
jgi:hypothetical protein